MRRRFATLDVFTDRRFAGNPLAVVLDAEALDAAAMQAIAREFNHPETVFVFAPAEPAHRARVRIFTPARELPFAGHPTVGTAVLLGARDGRGGDIVLEEGIGAVRCTLESTSGGGGSARFAIPQLPTEVGAPADDAAIAAGLSLAPSDIGEGRPARWSAGLPFTFVPIASLSAFAVPISPSSTPPSARAGRPTRPATRPPSRVTIFMPACSPPAWAFRKIPRPARPPPPLPACSRAACATAPTHS